MDSLTMEIPDETVKKLYHPHLYEVNAEAVLKNSRKIARIPVPVFVSPVVFSFMLIPKGILPFPFTELFFFFCCFTVFLAYTAEKTSFIYFQGRLISHLEEENFLSLFSGVVYSGVAYPYYQDSIKDESYLKSLTDVIELFVLSNENSLHGRLRNKDCHYDRMIYLKALRLIRSTLSSVSAEKKKGEEKKRSEQVFAQFQTLADKKGFALKPNARLCSKTGCPTIGGSVGSARGLNIGDDLKSE